MLGLKIAKEDKEEMLISTLCGIYDRSFSQLLKSFSRPYCPYIDCSHLVGLGLLAAPEAFGLLSVA